MSLPPREPWQAVDGLLLLDKPAGLSSTAALQRVRRVLRAEKAGHTGTLDPLASGLLPLCFGEATKFAQFLLDADKRYTATVTLGLTTTTGDAEGEPLERRPVSVSEAQVREVVARFVGEIEQVPPMHSALKRDGRPLYAYARAGQTVEREPRRVTIHSIECLGVGDLAPLAVAGAGEPDAASGSDETDRLPCIELDVLCSKGTYIRVLAEDIGRALGCGAHLSALRRTATSGWGIDQAVPLAQVDALDAAAAQALLLPVAAMVQHLPVLHLADADVARRFAHGQRIASGSGGETPALAVWGPALADAAPRFLGVAARDAAGVLRAIRLMAPVGATP